MANAPLPQVYLDLVGEVSDTDVTGQSILVYNRVPEPNERDVPVGAPIEITWADIAQVGISVATVTVESTAGLVTAVTISGGSPSYDSTYTSSSYVIQTSIGGSSPNEHKLQLVRSTPWASEERVNVRVRIVPNSGTTYDVIYSFYVADIAAPKLVSATTQGLDTLIVVFNEPMLMTADPYGALDVRDVTGRITFTETDTVEIERAGLAASDVGRFLCFAGSERAPNNAYFTITSVLSEDGARATVTPAEIRTEAPQLAHRGFLTPYKLAAVMEPDGRIPTFTPCVVAAEAIDDHTIRLFLDQELSPGRPYRLVAAQIADATVPANVTSGTTVSFVAETLPVVQGRKFSLWDAIPQGNKKEDTTGDLERFVRCFDEVAQLLIHDTDNFETINDTETAPEPFVDALLQHLGNPYTFQRSELEKRRIAASLVQTYISSGLERAIEESVQKILNISVNVFPFNNPDVGWVMGESEIGLDSILGTGDPFLKYSFEIIVFENRDIVAAGTDLTTVHLQTGGLTTDAYRGRTLRIGNDDRTILSNTPNTITVDEPYDAIPPTLSPATILGVLSDEERNIIKEIANIWRPAHTHFVRFIESGTVIPTF